MLRSNPHLIEINARLWLKRLRKKYSSDITISTVPEEEWLFLKHIGFDIIWLMGVWTPSPESVRIARGSKQLLSEIKKISPELNEEHIGASPYCIYDYKLNPELGLEWELKALKEKLNSLGMKLLLDFVTNHTSIDNPALKICPECFMIGTEQDYQKHPDWFFETEINGKKEYVAYGRDPNFLPWTDTAQLNYFNPKTREKMIETLFKIAEICDGVRCDMVMLTLNDIHESTWGWLSNKMGFEKPSEEFWTILISKIKEKFPEFIFLGEIYWGLEWKVQQMGFDYTYDKGTYDRLRYGIADDVRGHLRAENLYQKHSVRFIENHDESPAISSFGREKSMAAGVVISTIKGMRFYFDGQLNGISVKIPLQLTDCDIQGDIGISKFYEKLLKIVDHPAFHGGEWNLLEVSSVCVGDDTFRNVLSWVWTQRRTIKIVVVNYSDNFANCRINVSIKPTGDTTFLFEELSDRFIPFKLQDIQNGLVLEKIPPYNSYIFDLEF